MHTCVGDIYLDLWMCVCVQMIWLYSQHSWTALMEASEAGHTEIVRMLLDAGATLKQEKKVIYLYM